MKTRVNGQIKAAEVRVISEAGFISVVVCSG
jgi:hypothetical protein